MINIYGLYSTEDHKIRYVGKTKSSLKNRLSSHKYDALKKKTKNHKCNWIRSVYNDGFSIGIELIAITDEEHWEEQEIYWISSLKESNDLTNELKGGNSGGVGGRLQPFLDYDDAKNFIKNNLPSFSSITEYRLFLKKNKKIYPFLPLHPQDVYQLRKQWVNWSDFLSTNIISDNSRHDNFYSYDESVFFLKKLSLKTRKEYIDYIKSTKNTKLPYHPDRTYKNKGWVNYSTYLSRNIPSSKEKNQNFPTYSDAKKILEKYNILSVSDYRERLSKKEFMLPYHPDRTYKNKGWVNWFDYLGK